MDRSWLLKNRLSNEYKRGLNEFLDMAIRKTSDGSIIYPCKIRKNAKWVNREDAYEHLTVDGFIKGYTPWTTNAEDSSSNPINSHEHQHQEEEIREGDQFGMLNDMENLICEGLGFNTSGESLVDEPNEQAKAFFELLEAAKQELYPGCQNFSKLKFIIRLFQLKVTGKWSNKSFTMLLELLKEAFPDVTQSLPDSYYELQKIIRELGLSCVKIDACPNDCMLYWKEHANDTTCHVCNASRYTENECNSSTEDDIALKLKKVPANVLRYFPLKPRLQRLYMSSKTSSSMRWHDEECTKDGCMRHLSDSPLWNDFDRKYPDFSRDCRNVRLGLAADGFSPYITMSVAHSSQ